MRLPTSLRKSKFPAATLCCWVVVAFSTLCAASNRALLQTAVEQAFGGERGAAVVIRVSDGRVLAAHNKLTLARRIATPGSSIKPFVLQLMLEEGVVRPAESIFCRRGLTIAGKRLNCSHPPEVASFSAEDALAFSCNSYFTTAAARLKPGALERRFRELGFDHASGLLPSEGQGRLAPARTLTERQLLAIGAAGVEITPLELASAYLRLARLDPKRVTLAEKTVLSGIHGAVQYGLAANARVNGMDVFGKTGTASDPGRAVTHAWFAGFCKAKRISTARFGANPSESHPDIVVVVFVERGRGSREAATIAGRIFSSYAGQR